jgi:hypothetical protein
MDSLRNNQFTIEYARQNYLWAITHLDEYGNINMLNVEEFR